MHETADSTEIHGQVQPGFEPVREAFTANFEGEEVGASFAAFRDGRALVDLWGGHRDRAQTQPWERSTLANVWSTTKGLAALACAMLVDRGEMDYVTPVAHYWPEFAGHGKQDVTVAMLLSHQAGLCGPREPVGWLDYADTEKINGLLLGMEPLFEPGSVSGYHAISFGPLVGELFQRVAGCSLGSFLREQVAGPLSADVHLGLPESLDHMAAEMIGHPPSETPTEFQNEAQRCALGNPGANPEISNERAWRAAEICSVNGQACAAGLASIYGVLAAGGEVDGVRLMSRETIARAASCQIENTDLVLPVRMNWGCGYIRNHFKVIYGPNPEAFGHTGYGGAFGYADPVTRVGVGYAMNRMAASLLGDPRGIRLVRALHGCL